MTTARIDWATLAATPGAKCAHLFLIDGVNALFTLEGQSGITTIAVSGGTIDPDFWPGTGSVAAIVKPWLAHGITINEAVQGPDSISIDAQTVRLADLGGGATALFSSQRIATRTALTQSLGVGDTTIHVESNVGIASGDVVYIQQEAILVGTSSGVGTTLTGCTRGLYGSRDVLHTYAAAPTAGASVAVAPQVWTQIPTLLGRRGTYWIGQLSADGTTVTNPTLIYDGRVAPGTGTKGAHWEIALNPAWQYLDADIAAPDIQLSGLSHFPGDIFSFAQPLELYFLSGPVADSPDILLLDSSSATDNYGWHASQAAYIAAVNQAVYDTTFVGYTLNATITSTGTLRVFAGAPGACSAVSVMPWEMAAGSVFPVATEGAALESRTPFPTAWIQVGGNLVLTATEAAKLPSCPIATDPAGANVTIALVQGLDRNGNPNQGARPMVRRGGAIGPADEPVALVLSSFPDGTIPGGVTGAPSASIAKAYGTFPRSGTPVTEGAVFTTPTTLSVAVHVQAPTWPEALQGAALGWDALGQTSDVERSIDWERVAAVVSALNTSGIQPWRTYYLRTSVGRQLRQEALLSGLCVVPYRGRVAVAKIAQVAITELPALEITSATLARSCVPSVEQSSRGVTQSVAFDLGDGRTVRVVDLDALATLGAQSNGAKEITVTVPSGAIPRDADAGAIYATLTTHGLDVLGIWRTEYDVGTFDLTLAAADVSVGDVVRITEWLLPNGDGTRGLQRRAGIVMSRRVQFGGEGNPGRVTLGIRIAETDLAGYAPAALVAAVSGATLFLDTTTLGPAGWSPRTTDTDGGASWFEPGDVLELLELSTATPRAIETPLTVLSVSGYVVTMTASIPNASTWNTLAAAQPFGVMIRSTNYTAATNTRPDGSSQRDYAFFAKANGTLGSGSSPERYAA